MPMQLDNYVRENQSLNPNALEPAFLSLAAPFACVCIIIT